MTIEPFKGLLLGLLLRLGRGRDRSGVHRRRPGLAICSALAASLIALKAADRRRAGARLRPALAGRGGNGAAARAGRRVRLRDDRRGPRRRTGRSRLFRRRSSALIALSMLAIPLLGKLGALIDARRARAPIGPRRRRRPKATTRRVDHRRLRPGRRSCRRHAGRAQDPVRRRSTRSPTRRRARAAGKPVYYGDATRPEMLRRCGLDTARAVVVTMDRRQANETVVDGRTRRLRSDVTSSPAPATPTTPTRSTRSAPPTRCRKRSRRACSFPKRCWWTSACRWASVIASIHEKRGRVSHHPRRRGSARAAARGAQTEAGLSRHGAYDPERAPSRPADPARRRTLLARSKVSRISSSPRGARW